MIERLCNQPEATAKKFNKNIPDRVDHSATRCSTDNGISFCISRFWKVFYHCDLLWIMIRKNSAIAFKNKTKKKTVWYFVSSSSSSDAVALCCLIINHDKSQWWETFQISLMQKEIPISVEHLVEAWMVNTIRYIFVAFLCCNLWSLSIMSLFQFVDSFFFICWYIPVVLLHNIFGAIRVLRGMKIAELSWGQLDLVSLWIVWSVCKVIHIPISDMNKNANNQVVTHL